MPWPGLTNFGRDFVANLSSNKVKTESLERSAQNAYIKHDIEEDEIINILYNYFQGCVLSFASFLPTGLYGIALIVEDFLDAESTQPLSKIAVQFIVTISNRPCSNIPQFSGNTSNHGDKLKAIPGETWQTLITIHSSAYSIRSLNLFM